MLMMMISAYAAPRGRWCSCRYYDSQQLRIFVRYYNRQPTTTTTTTRSRGCWNTSSSRSSSLGGGRRRRINSPGGVLLLRGRGRGMVATRSPPPLLRQQQQQQQRATRRLLLRGHPLPTNNINKRKMSSSSSSNSGGIATYKQKKNGRSMRRNHKRRQKATLAAENNASQQSSSAQQQSQQQETNSYWRLLFNSFWRRQTPQSQSTQTSTQQTIASILRQPRTVGIPRWITPRHYQFTLAEIFGHGSFVLVAMSYAVDDFLLLRTIAVAGSTSMLVFTYFHPHGRILWLPFKWNVAFILINLYRIGKVYWNLYSAETFLPRELKDLRTSQFYLMDPVDYYRLMRNCEIRNYNKGDLIVAQGACTNNVRMVLSGKLKCLRDGKLTYYLEPANFLSEAGIHAGLLLPGRIESCCTIVADEPSRVLSWDRTELVHLMELQLGVRRSLKAILSWDIVRKLKAQRGLLADDHHDNDDNSNEQQHPTTHVIDDPEEWTLRRKEQTNHRYAAILQNVLRQNLLEKFRLEIDKYRKIHHIDDIEHARALQQCGWSMEDYEFGRRRRKNKQQRDGDGKTTDPNRRVKKRSSFHPLLAFQYDDDDDDDDFIDDDEEEEEKFRDWKWYMQDIYLRFFG